MLLFIGGFGISELLIILIPIILWIWALTDVIKSSFKDDSTKIIWALVIILLPVVGVFLYFLIGRGQRVIS